jgi:propane monooxygenase reductase component
MTAVHTVTVLPADVSFECTEDETVLAAAIRRGFALPYGCRKGHCGTCKAQVLEGDVDLDVEVTHALSSFERDRGMTLLCSAFAYSDSTIEMEGLDATELAGATEVRELSATVVAVEPLTHDIRRLELALDGDLPFRAGQFAELNPAGTDVWRSYSMASPPSAPARAEFMIKAIPGGAFSTKLEATAPGDRFTLRGPLGSFWLRDHDRPLLLVGGGAGMAPLWSMLQDLVQRGDARPVRFFYGARTASDLFHLDAVAALGKELADFEFVPALSDAPAGGEGPFDRGLVTDVLHARLGRTIGEHDAYLCGPPPMIDAALELLEGFGLEERRSIFYDKFTAS